MTSDQFRHRTSRAWPGTFFVCSAGIQGRFARATRHDHRRRHDQHRHRAGHRRVDTANTAVAFGAAVALYRRQDDANSLHGLHGQLAVVPGTHDKARSGGLCHFWPCNSLASPAATAVAVPSSTTTSPASSPRVVGLHATQTVPAQRRDRRADIRQAKFLQSTADAMAALGQHHRVQARLIGLGRAGRRRRWRHGRSRAAGRSAARAVRAGA